MQGFFLGGVPAQVQPHSRHCWHPASCSHPSLRLLTNINPCRLPRAYAASACNRPAQNLTNAGYPTLDKGQFDVGDDEDHDAIEQSTRLSMLELPSQLVKMEVRVIKIEGHQRSPAYAAQVTKTWREAIDPCHLNPPLPCAKAGLTGQSGQANPRPATHWALTTRPGNDDDSCFENCSRSAAVLLAARHRFQLLPDDDCLISR